MNVLARWLSHSLGTALALGLGIVAMQAPAFTHEYASALMQVAAELRRDISQREDSARQFYGINFDSDEALINALHAREPSNAESLARSLARARNLQLASDDIVASSPLLQPLVALQGAWDDPHGYRASIWTTSLLAYNAQLSLGFAAAIYGLAGLMLGSLVAQLILAPFQRARPHRQIGDEAG